MNRALIIVDVQNDFLPGGSLAVPDGDAIISFVAELMQADQGYELIVATQDWHPDKHGSFASTHSGSQPFQLGELNGLEQVFWPDHCVQGSDGARLQEHIRKSLIEITKKGQQTLIIKKGQNVRVDSYSAFYDNAQKHDTGLHRALESYTIGQVDVVGLAFDYCVKFTALDAVSLGYKTRILMAGTRAVDPSSVPEITSELETAGVECRR